MTATRPTDLGTLFTSLCQWLEAKCQELGVNGKFTVKDHDTEQVHCALVNYQGTADVEPIPSEGRLLRRQGRYSYCFVGASEKTNAELITSISRVHTAFLR